MYDPTNDTYLVYWCLGKVRHMAPTVEREELVSAGMLGLVEAANNYDPSLGYKFATFAVDRIKGAMLDHIRKELNYQVRIISTDKLEQLPYHTSGKDNGNPIKLLDLALACLVPRDRQFIQLYYYDEAPLKEIQRIMGISASWSSELHIRIKGRLQAMMRRLRKRDNYYE